VNRDVRKDLGTEEWKNPDNRVEKQKNKIEEFGT
jgi:hypothetical protein